MTYPFKNITLNRNRKIIAVAKPADDIQLMVSQGVPNVTNNYIGVWSATLLVEPGNIVLWQATTWLALAPSINVTPTTSAAQWQSLGSYSQFLGAWSSTAAYAVGAEVTYQNGFWVATAANTNQAPITGSAYWQAAGSTVNPTAVATTIASTADANGNYLASGSTSQLIDDAGLGNTAAFSGVSGLPTTLGGYGIANGQPALGAASGNNYILSQNGASGPTWQPQYGFNLNSGYAALANTTLSLNSLVTVGSEIRLPNPGVNCTIFVIMSGQYAATGNVTVSPAFLGEIQISTNGGTSFTSSPNINLNSSIVAAANFPFAGTFCLPNVTPTGDVVVQFQAEYSVGTTTGAFSANKGSLCVFMMPVANFSVVAGALSVAVPSTETASCTSTYPTTTCAALQTITATPNAGTPPYTYSWTRTGGTGAGTIVSGATSITVSVSGTETGTVSGASYTDIYQCVVTDSLSATANGSCTVTSTYTLAYAAIVPSMATNSGVCNTGTSPGTCTASANFTASATGGNGSYTYSNIVLSYQSGFSINPTIASGATSATGSYSGAATTTPLPGTKLSVTLQTTINDTRGTGAQSASGTGSLIFKYVT